MAIEFFGCGAREPIQLDALGLGELGHEDGVGIGDALFLFVDEGFAEDEKSPVAVGDEDVVEEFAEIRVFCGRLMLTSDAKKVGVCPPFVPDELVNQEQHGRNLADDGPTQFH